ncbi:MAG: hypothetical protein DWB56_14905 [Candidatus Jettenia sp.]|uniref:Holin n=1 Tax=Candidatus Jettenia caeni TaxID=247490 RepID=I3ILQ6_9BACT|nr:hypothetical protein [Candidatus Jettenia sp. AMX1]KAA0243567.1 MAG: hypothetical protein EDM70_09945 [Candidatus Brocadia sp. AMX2]MBC6930222.1 hypothetical protein [Candidatus Jettenia sp.]GAB62651.1 hypothetical protein KSU1_C1055 [Candidatus Jettenia caeni]MCQ3927095.1 hypothetical protein [Candidatus Jettenia sp.]MDL1939881.1 hypothetical protein [Candidatus Jettenia sp. AMX1]
MKLLEFLQENDGGLSASRLFPFVIMCCMATDWMHAVFTAGAWKPDIQLIILFLGAMGFKVLQKPFENK